MRQVLTVLAAVLIATSVGLLPVSAAPLRRVERKV